MVWAPKGSCQPLPHLVCVWGGWAQGLFNILIKEFLPLKHARLDKGLQALAFIFLLRQESQFSGFLYFLPLRTSSWLFQLLKGPS